MIKKQSVLSCKNLSKSFLSLSMIIGTIAYKFNSENKYDDLGDTSTLADPTVVTHLIENRLNK